LTFDSFNDHLLEPNDADLLLCVAQRGREARDNEYFRRARHTKVFDERRDYTPLYDTPGRCTSCATRTTARATPRGCATRTSG
jgi:hypothetical protein